MDDYGKQQKAHRYETPTKRDQTFKQVSKHGSKTKHFDNAYQYYQKSRDSIMKESPKQNKLFKDPQTAAEHSKLGHYDEDFYKPILEAEK